MTVMGSDSTQTPPQSNPIDMEIEEIPVFLDPVFQAFVDGIVGFEGHDASTGIIMNLLFIKYTLFLESTLNWFAYAPCGPKFSASPL